MSTRHFHSNTKASDEDVESYFETDISLHCKQFGTLCTYSELVQFVKLQHPNRAREMTWEQKFWSNCVVLLSLTIFLYLFL